jgi:hypothetical protein
MLVSVAEARVLCDASSPKELQLDDEVN